MMIGTESVTRRSSKKAAMLRKGVILPKIMFRERRFVR